MIIVRWFSMFVLVFLTTATASAQSAVSGVVRDPNGAGFLAFTVQLEPFEQVSRDVSLTFGPFSEEWTVLPAALLDVASNQIRFGSARGMRCSDRLLLNINGVFQPFCGLSFIVDEFEADDANRRRAIVLRPRVVRAPDQRYPAALAEVRVEGTVTLDARVGTDGAATVLGVLSATDASLVEAALASVRSATWEPARIRGIAVDVPLTITIQFRLQEAPSPPRPAVVQSISLLRK